MRPGAFNPALSIAFSYPSELGVPIAFQAPTASDLLSQQLSMLETFVNDGYTGVTFSAIDRKAPAPIIEKAVAQGTIMLNMDSDATGSKRASEMCTPSIKIR